MLFGLDLAVVNRLIYNKLSLLAGIVGAKIFSLEDGTNFIS